MENYDLKFLKKYYGEKFSHLCRTFFSDILAYEGLLSKVIYENFAPSKNLYYDIVNDNAVQNIFKMIVYSKVNIQDGTYYDNKNATVEELLGRMGYKLYECKTDDEIMSFKKYYAQNEELCTFREDRLSTHYVFFAVKDNAETIKRENFTKPEREDEYSTSVLGIQFARGKLNNVSIKSRYNHSVLFPDATFQNQLDAICPGLKEAFKKEYGFNFNAREENYCMPNYINSENGRLYRFNTETVDEAYFCENNVALYNGKVKQFPKDKYILIENYLVNKENKTIQILKRDLEENDEFYYGDSFTESIGKIQDIKEIFDTNKDRQLIINVVDGENVIITLNSLNEIIGYYNPNVQKIGQSFLPYNKKMRKLVLPKVKTLGDAFLKNNSELVELELPKLENIGNEFLYMNKKLANIDMSKVKNIGDEFLYNNNVVTQINMPNVDKIGSCFMVTNTSIANISAPKLQYVGNSFLRSDGNIMPVNFPALKEVGDMFLAEVRDWSEINFPNLENIGQFFMMNCTGVRRVCLENARFVGTAFLQNNEKANELHMEKVERIENGFMPKNKYVKTIDMNNLLSVGAGFFEMNKEISVVNMEKVETIGANFLKNNGHVKEIKMDNLLSVGKNFMSENTCLKLLSMKEIKEIGNNFLSNNETLKEVVFENLLEVGDNFMQSGGRLKRVSMPNVLHIGSNFLKFNKDIKELDIHNVIEIGDDFMYYGGKSIEKLSLLDLTRVGSNFISLGRPGEIEVNKDFDISQITEPRVLSALNIVDIERE